jgi:hypothetical protein
LRDFLLRYAVFLRPSARVVSAGGNMDGNMDRPWRSLGTLCRERDWSKPRLLDELRNGLRYRTIPLGHAIDWHHPQVEREVRALRIELAALQACVDELRGVVAAEAARTVDLPRLPLRRDLN